ncbi:MAG: HDIG domain-containing protein [Chitinivibrionales bacterium]|nr:HDIG domain-containing protein [Chitinivibrionales bacterium]
MSLRKKESSGQTGNTSTATANTNSAIVFEFKKKKITLPRYITLVILAFAVLIIGSIGMFPFLSAVQQFNLPKKGEVSKETIIAPITFDILKQPEELEKDRKEAMDEILLVFDRDKNKQKMVQQKLTLLKSDLYAISSDSTTSDSLRSIIRTRLKKEISDNTVAVLSQNPFLLDDVALHAEKLLKNGVISILLVPAKQQLEEIQRLYNKQFENHLIYNKMFITLREDTVESTIRFANLPIKEEALDIVLQALKNEKKFEQEALNAMYEILDSYLMPNIAFNGEETARRRVDASRLILSTKGKILKNTEIVRTHQEITADILEKLISLHAALEMQQQGQEAFHIIQNNIGNMILIVLLIILFGLYLIFYYRDLFRNPKHFFALVFIILLQFFIIRIGLILLPRLFEMNVDREVMTPEYFIPTALASILVALLFGYKVSLMVTLFVSLYFSIAVSFNHSLFIYSLLGGFIAGFVTQKIRYRWDFFKAMPPIIIMYSLCIMILQIIGYKFAVASIVQDIGFCVINCIITILLSMTTVIAFEYLFDITTNMTLIELSDMNHPLLKKLSIEAAGTYNHSVLVANLAESAAERVGANPLLARVASYYHDVGKIFKPNYFVENQRFEKNIHDKLSPNMSALIISSHVKEGIELARKYKLPSVVQQAIVQHHGTSTISFFYEKALELDPHNQVQESEFRYPGPCPQTKETAILMLADSVEAASRSLSNSSPKMLRSLVKKIIHDKFASSQLDECDLTFQDLDKIIEGFMPVLQGIFHTRIEYPLKRSGVVHGK